MPANGSLERNQAKRDRLIYELAKGEKNQTELAMEFGATQSAVSIFKGRHADEIAVHKEHLAEEYFGVWIAQKRNRVLECQADVDAINEALDGTADDKLLKTKLAILRQVAEELGQLKETVELTGRITYAVEGVDLGSLQ